MIFAVIGLFKQPRPIPGADFEAAVNEHLAQPAFRIVNAGYLRDEKGEPVGVMALLDVESIAQANTFLRSSPFHMGGHYERVEVAAYDVEVGRLG